MLKFLFQKIRESIVKQNDLYSQLNPWSNIYGLARSLMAISLLLTIIFSDTDYLFISKEIHNKSSLFVQLNFFYLFDNIIISKFISLLILIVIISGYFVQITGFLHWWLAISFLYVSPVIEGGDQLNVIVTLLLIPITVTDNRKNHWHDQIDTDRPKLKIVMWMLFFLISLQVALVYFQAGVAKLNVVEWANGPAVYYWATHNIFGVNEFFFPFVNWLFSHKIIVVLTSWGTIVLEIIFFGWLFMKRNEWNWLLLFLLGFFFHLGIIFLFGLFSFFFSMLGSIVLYYFPKNNSLDNVLSIKIRK